MNNQNIDSNMMNNIKNMVDNGDISGAISQISPEMIQNFQKMLNNNNENQSQNNYNSSNVNSDNSQASGNLNNFDFSKIDMNTMMKMTSILNNMNNKDDPRSNLIYSLKPYLRDSKKQKLDQYANLLNISKMADLFKNENKEKP